MHLLKPVICPIALFLSAVKCVWRWRRKRIYTDFAHQTPRPNTAYGKSKLLAENYIKSISIFLTSYCVRPVFMARATKTISS